MVALQFGDVLTRLAALVREELSPGVLAEWVFPGVTTSPSVGYEIGTLVIVCSIALVGGWRERLVGLLGPHLGALARRPAASLLGVFAFAVTLRLALLPVAPLPVPSVHDEFSYLLAADTFVHGRVANPAHPLWPHFETIHVDQRPTYASMYPPVQGLILAAGMRLGHPWLGVLLSVGVMCAAFTWMLRGWISAEWALAGGLLAALRLGTFGYWANSYYGGAHAATAGALVLGALPRLRHAPTATTGITAAVGIGLVANSRPFEGLLVTAGAGLTLLWWIWRGDAPGLRLQARALWPAVVVLVAVGAASAYFNWRVWGSSATLPYTVNRATYAVTPTFIVQPLRPEPTYHNEELRRFYVDWEPRTYRYMRTPYGFRHAVFDRYRQVVSFFFGPALFAPLLLALPVLADRRRRPVIAVSLIVCGAMFLSVWMQPHYVAAVSAVFYLVAVAALERNWEQRAGPRALRRAVVVAACLALAGNVGVTAVRRLAHLEAAGEAGWTLARPKPAMLERARIEQALASRAGRHLIVVRYAPDHNVHDEWVYNGADINGAPVVWARTLGDDKDRALLAYFSGRSAWLLEPDVDPPRLQPLR